ncbi:hypothetical protein ABZZ79_15060 [Streptomyces sp. NPDC006458]|uniref:hypothetical protein n=1 Tax=Streptomyces sp. NPDC006458 TaxID=3154302 RepID=UPI0033AF9123
MTRPAIPSALLASLLGTVLAATACTTTAPAARQKATTPASSTSTPAPPPSAPALTEAQAHAALISEADLGEPWTPTQGAATWRDAFLKAKAAQPDCGRLLDALYTDELLGAPARAAVGLDDGWDEAQLRHQVTAQPPAEVDRALAWLGGLPGKCGRFTATSSRGTPLSVTVDGIPLPEVGDARQGLLVTVSEETDGEWVTLTLLAAAARVGEDAFTVTTGGLGDVPPEALEAAVGLGAQRLAEVRKQGRVQV